MTLDTLDRRRFLGTASAGLLAGAIGSTRAEASADRPERVVDRRSPAAGAGVLLLGGDLEVARMGFGAMRLTGEGIWGEPRDARAARAILRRATGLGVNFIDTADSYGPDVSERLIAEALHPYARGLVVATKGGMTRAGPNQWAPDGRPERLRAACEASLRRLKLERHELYQLHAVDPRVPLEDSIGELARLQSEGRIRHIGVSNVDVQQLERARRLVRVVSVQNRYNVVDRTSDPVLAVCERDGIAFIPWAPLARRAQVEGSDAPALAALRAVAESREISMPRATLAWLLARSPAVLPIPGTSTPQHLEENVTAASIRLTPAEMQRIG
jgi:aryl-alcohol dehydrogenase-like predicted oxidoreductase